MPFIKSGNQLKFEHEGMYYPVGGFKQELSENEKEGYVEELNNSKPSRHDEMLEWTIDQSRNFPTARQLHKIEFYNDFF